MDQALREYFISELWIHDDLVKQAERSLVSIEESWRLEGHVDPFLISWPANDVYANDGSKVKGPVLYSLEKSPAARRRQILEAIEQTGPYGLLMCEELKTELCVLFETQHGAVSWHFPIEPRGSHRVMGKVTRRRNRDHIGILWRAPSSRS